MDSFRREIHIQIAGGAIVLIIVGIVLGAFTAGVSNVDNVLVAVVTVERRTAEGTFRVVPDEKVAMGGEGGGRDGERLEEHHHTHQH